jgi:D-beta-D-heptose 7-phosphate kinase/D-beta-D-heptose 1-phosphate adenosyltransferase
MEVVAMGRVGHDEFGEQLLESLQKSGAATHYIFKDPHFQTPVKKRMIAGNQQLLRVDYESVTDLTQTMEEKMKEHLEPLIRASAVVAISDYGKGLLTPSFLAYTIDTAQKYGIPVIVDPKGRDFTKYRGATLIKPNAMEAFQSVNAHLATPINEVATAILQNTGSEVLMITRAKEGISLFWKSGDRGDFPAQVKEVRDVTGAGDTVLAMVTVTLANRIDLKQGAVWANIAAGIALEHLGCARVTLAEIAERIEFCESLAIERF